MESSLVSISNEVAGLVERFQSQVVAVHARPHYPSSGILWRPGIIVTADHTVRREENIQLTLPGGDRTEAEMVGRDSGSDVAVLRAEGLDFPAGPAEQADPGSPPRIGELALVLGRSPDSGPNVSLGVISAFSGPWRTWRGGRLDHYIRLDATLFPNSSGGAVLDGRGRLLGVATSALSRFAGLAIPAQTVNRVVNAVVEKGRVARGYLGIGVQLVTLPEALRSSLALGNKYGVMVVSVDAGGPADQAGVFLGDILVGLGETSVAGIEDLQAFSDADVIGKPVRARILRSGGLQEVTITPGERPGN